MDLPDGGGADGAVVKLLEDLQQQSGMGVRWESGLQQQRACMGGWVGEWWGGGGVGECSLSTRLVGGWVNAWALSIHPRLACLVDGLAEGGLDDALDVGEVLGGDVVLEDGEPLEVLPGEEVVPRAGHLVLVIMAFHFWWWW